MTDVTSMTRMRASIMGEPTIYRRPTPILPAKPPKKRDLEKWQKHRTHKGKDPSAPRIHKN